MKTQKYSLGDLAPLAIAFVVVTVVLGVGATILANVQSNATSEVAYNSTEFGLKATNTLASWLPTIAIIVAASVVIGIIVMYFRMSG